MEMLDPYMMPDYYWYDHADLASGMQMINIMDMDHFGWEHGNTFSHAELDAGEDITKYKTAGQTKLNPTAPDFSPRNLGLSDQKDWICKRQPIATQNNNYVINIGNDQLKMSAVSMDFVLAANYIMNDMFSFIPPEIPMPRSKVDRNVHPTKKNNSPKAYKSKTSSCGGIILVKPEISYEKEELMAIAKSPLCQVTPQALQMIAKNLPRLVRREGPTANILIKEVRAIKKQDELHKSGRNSNYRETILSMGGGSTPPLMTSLLTGL